MKKNTEAVFVARKEVEGNTERKLNLCGWLATTTQKKS
jgi:hypothetical protein